MTVIWAMHVLAYEGCSIVKELLRCRFNHRHPSTVTSPFHSPIFSSRLSAVWPELSTSPDQLSLLFVISCRAAIRASRFGPALTRPELICRPSSHQSAAVSDFEAPSRVPDLWLVLNDDFGPAASHIRSSPGEADRLAAGIGPQAQRKQIGETEGSFDV
jgi:hypothetical protein